MVVVVDHDRLLRSSCYGTRADAICSHELPDQTVTSLAPIFLFILFSYTNAQFIIAIACPVRSSRADHTEIICSWPEFSQFCHNTYIVVVTILSSIT